MNYSKTGVLLFVVALMLANNTKANCYISTFSLRSGQIDQENYSYRQCMGNFGGDQSICNVANCSGSPINLANIAYQAGQVSTPTKMVGGGGGSVFKKECPPGTFVTGIDIADGADGGSKKFLSSIRMVCGDGSAPVDIGNKQVTRAYAPIASPNGFSKISVRSGTLVDHLSVYVDPKATWPTIQAGGTGGGAEEEIKCASGGVISGFYGRRGRVMDAIGLLCRSREQIKAKP